MIYIGMAMIKLLFLSYMTKNRATIMIRYYKANTKGTTSIYKTFGNLLFWIIIFFLVTIEVFSFADKLSNYNFAISSYRLSVISSQSMSYVDSSNEFRLEGITNQYAKGDIILTKEYQSFNEVKVNDVVTYFNGETLVCHRVIEKVEKNEIYYVITQGDANNSNDGLVNFNNVKGKVVGSCKYLGYVTLYLQSPYGLFCISSLAFIIVVCAIYNEIVNKKYREI